MNYTLQDGQFYKVTDKDTGVFISVGELKESNVLSTIHNVEFISKEQFESEAPVTITLPTKIS